MLQSANAISNSGLSKLKEAILDTVFNGRPLPGSTAPVTFPDLPFVFTQPQVYLLDEGPVNPVYIEKLHRPLMVVSNDILKGLAGKTEKLIYLEFSSGKKGKNSIWITLESKVLSGNRPVGVSSLQLTFQRAGDEWQLLDQPTSSSA